MTEAEVLALRLRAVSDQSKQSLRENIESIAAVASKDSSEWTDRDKMVAHMALYGLLGLMYEGILDATDDR